LNESVATSLLAARPGAAALPSVDRLLGLAFIPALLDEFGRAAVSGAIRTLLDDKRHAIVDGATPEGVWPPGVQWLEGELRARLESQSVPRLRRVFNLTGTVLHTNLGRAPLPEEAVHAVANVMRSAVNLEYDLDSGRRGERDELVEVWLCELTGAQSATRCATRRRTWRRGRERTQ